MKRPRIVALGALAVLVGATGLVMAQDDAGVKLEYKWTKGQTFRYKLTGGGTITMKMDGLPIPAGAPGAPPAGGFPMEMQMDMELSQKVKEVSPDGSATLSQQLHTMDMTNKVMGQQIVAKFSGGKFAMTLNGQAMPAPGQLGDAGAMMGKATDVKLTRRGQLLSLDAGARQAMARVFGGTQLGSAFSSGAMGAGMLILPEAPVKAGEIWNDKQSNVLPLQGGFPGGGGGGPMDVKVDYTVQNTLLRFEGEGAGRTAVIGTKAELTMPQADLKIAPDPKKPEQAIAMTIRAFTQKVNGTINFDPAMGLVRGGDYAIDMAMKMDLPFGPPGGDGPKPQMSMDGALKMKIALLPNGKSASPANN